MIRVSYHYSGNLVSFTFLNKAIFATEEEDVHLNRGWRGIVWIGNHTCIRGHLNPHLNPRQNAH